MKTYFFIALIILLTACSSGEECHIQIKEMGPKLSVYMTKMFEEHGIPFKLTKENVICIPQTPIDAFFKVMNLFAATYLPEDRSISADVRLLDRYEAMLSWKNIKYEKYIFDGNTFLAWNEENKEIVAKLILEENNKFFSEIDSRREEE